MNIAMQLLKGSRNTDLMCEQISNLIKMLLGMNDYRGRIDEVRFEGQYGWWYLKNPTINGCSVAVEYWRKTDPETDIEGQSLVFRTTHSQVAIGVLWVYGVYSDLDVFVRGFAETFPGAANSPEWAALILNSSVQMPS